MKRRPAECHLKPIAYDIASMRLSSWVMHYMMIL